MRLHANLSESFVPYEFLCEVQKLYNPKAEYLFHFGSEEFLLFRQPETRYTVLQILILQREVVIV
ncbi:MAG: hypothetical protein Q8T13_00005, partial [Acidobacteriota bacterium]|nr:hypothetical protein [Acidobacteriota bacterium]